MPAGSADAAVRILLGDCRERLSELPESSVDSIVCDPPYELGFMGKSWDASGVAYSLDVWKAAFRALKPGGHLLAFSGTRTYHRMTVAIEDAGFEVRDQLAWVYGSGFPKSLDVSKAIDKAAGAERTVVGIAGKSGSQRKCMAGDFAGGEYMETAPATEAAQQWQGWGTALKPSWESICLAQKPYDLRQLCGILAHKIAEAVCQLPSLAEDAEPSSWLSQSVFGGAFFSVQWRAVVRCNTPGALFDLMATSLSEAKALPTSLNTAWLWLNTLAAISELESTFTTETASSLTTDLKTLNCLLSSNTPTIIAGAAILQHGEPSDVSLAASLFSAVSARLRFIQGASAVGLATSQGDDWDIRPSLQPICLARKPLIGSVAANVLKHGCGALNIDGCRIEGQAQPFGNGTARSGGIMGESSERGAWEPTQSGRWPANLCHDGSDEVVEQFPNSKGGHHPAARGRGGIGNDGHKGQSALIERHDTGSGSAARFFYCAKASKADRGEGNDHPTVKPQALMRWLCRLITPPGGVVLDPFLGSGSTGLAAMREGFRFIGIELNPEYVAIAERRLGLDLA